MSPGEGRLAQSHKQCASSRAAQCHTRGTRLTTGFIGVGCCPADTATLLQLWMPFSQRLLGVSAGHSAGGGDKTLVLRRIVADVYHINLGHIRIRFGITF